MSFNENWGEYTLKEIATLKRGYDLPKSKRFNGNFPILASNGIVGYHNQFKVEGPGVTTGRSGTLGKVFYIKDNFWPLNTSLYIKDFHGNDEGFIYYYLQTLDFKNYNGGSSVPTLNRNHIHTIRVKIPSLLEQKSISAILFSLDGKIELNNQINKNLEKIAQAIFKHWFLDFEFPDENSEPYKSSGGEMVDSEIGAIPKGWKIIRLEYVVDEKKFSIVDGPFGTQLHAEEYQEIGIPVIRITNLSFEGNFLRDSLVYITEEKFNHLIRSAVYPGEILLAKTGATIGKLARLPKSIKKGLIASSVMKISPNYKKFNEYYLFNVIKELSNRQYWESVSGGSTRPTINLADVKDVKLIYPSNKYVMKKYHEKVNHFYKLIEHNQEQNITLSKIRDILLPKLMSGEIRVPINSKNFNQLK